MLVLGDGGREQLAHGRGGGDRHLCHAQVTDEELGLVGDGVFERLSAVDVEVADGVALDLPARGGRRVAQRGVGGGDGVGVADAEQDRRVDLLRRSAWAVQADVEEEPGGDAVVKVGASGSARGIQARSPGTSSALRTRRADERHHDRRLPAPAGQLVAEPQHRRVRQAAWVCRPGGREAIGEWALADYCGDAAVTRGGDEHVTAAEGGAPECDALGIDLLEGARIGERRGPVAELALDVEQLARCPPLSPKCR